MLISMSTESATHGVIFLTNDARLAVVPDRRVIVLDALPAA